MIYFFLFGGSGQQEGAAAFDLLTWRFYAVTTTTRSIETAVNYSQTGNMCRRKHFLVYFLATWRKDCASVNVSV